MASEIQRRIRRSKETERDTGKWLIEHDGIDPKWAGISSSTARVGHITQLQFDVISKHYAGEVKNVKLPATILKWWLQIIDVSITHGKDALLVIRPSNVVSVRGVPKKTSSLHIITEARHAELLKKEKVYDSGDYIY